MKLLRAKELEEKRKQKKEEADAKKRKKAEKAEEYRGLAQKVNVSQQIQTGVTHSKAACKR